METKIERLDGDKVKFDITIDAAEVDEAIDSVYDEVKKTARIPGFRKGKTPRTVLEHQFGAEYFSANATVNLIEKHSPEVVDSNGMVPFGDYSFDADESAKPGEDYTYSFTIQVKPEYELTSTDPVSVQVLDPVATDEEIDARIDMLRGYYIDLKSVDDRPAKEDDIVAFSQECFVDGSEIEDGKSDRRTCVLGSGMFSKEFEDQLLGMSVGDTKEIEAAADDLALSDDHEGKLTAKVTVTEITEKVVPELTDEWAKENCDVEDVEALRKQVGEGITTDKEARAKRDKTVACLKELVKRLEGAEVPEYMKAEETTKALRNVYMNLQAQGYTLDQYLMATGQNADEFYHDMENQGETAAKQSLALDALARALQIECTEDDVKEAFEGSGADDPAAIREEWENDHRMSVLREEIVRDKAAKWLQENAIVEYVDSLPEEEDDEADDSADDAEAEESAVEDAAADDAATEESAE